MEPKLNPELKRFLSNPEIGAKVTSEIISNNNKISPVIIELKEFGQVIELIPIGYTGKDNISQKK
ncbi:MAG: hypothetical protein ABIP51_16520 [Bacteroidia bacterium]